MTNVLADRLSVNLDWPEPFVTLAPNSIYHAGVLKSNIRQVIFCAHWSHNCDMSNEKDVWKQKKCEMCVQLNCLCKNSHNDVEFIATTKCNTSVLSSAVHPPPHHYPLWRHGTYIIKYVALSLISHAMASMRTIVYSWLSMKSFRVFRILLSCLKQYHINSNRQHYYYLNRFFLPLSSLVAGIVIRIKYILM